MLDFTFNNLINFLFLFETSTADCANYLGKNFITIMDEIFMAIQFSVPGLVVILGTVDMVKATVAQDDKAMKDATSNLMKRLIIAAVIFFVPVILGFILGLAGLVSGTCGIG